MNRHTSKLAQVVALATLGISSGAFAGDTPAAEHKPAVQAAGETKGEPGKAGHGPGQQPGRPAIGKPPAEPGKGPRQAGPGQPGVGQPFGMGPHGMAPHAMGPGGLGGPGADPAARNKQMRETIEKLKKDGKKDQAEALERMLNAPQAAYAQRPPLTPEELKKRRETRKFARLRMMHRRYGESLKRPELSKEIGLHAQRTARLSQVRKVTLEMKESPEREKRLQRVNELMGIENSRHQRKLASLAPEAPQNVVNAIPQMKDAPKVEGTAGIEEVK